MPDPYRYIHLETGILLILLAMLFAIQLERTAGGGRYSRNPKSQALGLLALFASLSLVFGFFLFSVSPLLAVELAAGFTLSMLHPVNALCFFVHMLFLRPWEILPQNAGLLMLPKSFSAACFIAWMLHPSPSRKLAPRSSRMLMLLLAFSALLFLSTFQARDVAAAQSEWLDSYFKAVVIFAMCLLFIRSERSVREFQNTLLISILGTVALGFYQLLSEPSSPALPESRLRSFGMIADPNDLAAISVVALPLAASFIFKRPARLFQRFSGVLLSALSALAVWYARSRGAMLALIVQAFGWRYFDRARAKRLNAAMAAGFLGLGYFGLTKAVPRESEDMERSAESRVIYWKAALNMTFHHPLSGVGYGQYPANYEYYSPPAEKYEWGLRTAHSSWLLVFAESGLAGGALFVLFFAAAWKMAWRNRKKYPAQLYALAGYGIAMSFLSHAYTPYLYMLCGLIAASDSADAPVPSA